MLVRPRATGLNVAEFYKKHAPPRTVLGNLEQFHNASESGTAGERRGNIGEGHLEDRSHNNLSRRTNCITWGLTASR